MHMMHVKHRHSIPGINESRSLFDAIWLKLIVSFLCL